MLLLFFLVWLIFNGAFTVEIAVFGVVIALLVFAFICKFMDHSLYFLGYIFTLIVEIIRANIAVTRLILSRREMVEPVMVTFHTDLKSRTARVILANSITLTPGTITVSLNGDRLIVHCLDKSMADGMEDSVFVQMLRKLERLGE